MSALLLAAALTVSTAVPAFPGAEGAGAYSLGGRGGAVLRVTNLNDDGPGSLRAALEAEGPRTIIFDTGGTITLKRPLEVRTGRVTIAGQTAPGDGITLRGQPFRIHADDVIVRYLRVRLGDEQGIESDAFEITGGRRIMVDHVSASWSIDESLSIGSVYKRIEDGPYDITVQWSIIAQSLNKSLHAKGQHGYGTLLRCSHGAKVTFHHNLWAHHIARMPRPGNTQMPPVDNIGPFYQFHSNVFYNWGGKASGYNADQGRKASIVSYDFINNAYIPGPNSQANIAFEEANPNARLYFAGNSMAGTIPADPWALVDAPVGIRRAVPLADMPVLAPDPAPNALPRVLARAGASVVRDRIDETVVDSVENGTGSLIDSQSQVGGWPVLDQGKPWVDSDNDGLPDAWELVKGLNPKDNQDARRAGPHGYTNLEGWLNALAPS